MNVLIDTHVFLWFMAGDDQLSQLAMSAIDTNEVKCFLSIASIWEMAIKYNSGKLQLSRPFDILIPQLVLNHNINLLDISLNHLIQVANLPSPHSSHKDPFDRLIIAQAMVEKMPIIWIDAKLDAYDVQRLW